MRTCVRNRYQNEVSVPQAKDHYRIELLLSHTEMSAAAILKSLPLVPRINESIGEDYAKVTFIAAPLEEGYSSGECQDALRKVTAFIAKHKQFLKNFSGD